MITFFQQMNLYRGFAFPIHVTTEGPVLSRAHEKIRKQFCTFDANAFFEKNLSTFWNHLSGFLLNYTPLQKVPSLLIQ